MKYLKLASVTTALILSVNANAAVITFDNVTSTTGYELMPSNYGGFDWTMAIMNSANTNVGSGYDLGRVSGEYVTYFSLPATVSISSGTFNFNGAYFASSWDNSLSIVLEGLNSSSVLFTDTIVVNNQGPTWFNANYIGIDRLRIITQGGQFVMDDFTYNEISNVPVPASIFLFGSGLIGLFSIVKRNKA